MCAPCRCVSRRDAHGWVKGTCALSKGARGQMQAQSSRLGEKESMPLSADNISASHRYIDPAQRLGLVLPILEPLIQLSDVSLGVLFILFIGNAVHPRAGILA